MNAATARQMPVRYIGSNRHAIYWKVNESYFVLHNTDPGAAEFTCTTCRLNDCLHIDCVKDHLDEHGTPAE